MRKSVCAHVLLWSVGLSMMSGCALSPAQNATPPELPSQWRDSASNVAAASTHVIPAWPTAAFPDALSADWWRGFGSDELDALVSQAQTQSLDIAASAARIRQAQAAARIAGASLMPEVSADLQTGRQGRFGGHANVDGTTYTTGFNTRYEVDFWGRNRAASASALHTLSAARFDHDTLQLAVTAGVASVWVQAVMLAERTLIATQNLHSAQRLLALVKSQFDAGSATALALAQQRTLVAAQQRIAAALRQQADNAQIALTQLIGQTADLPVRTTSLATITMPGINADVPSSLLVRRPDIARAEARLAAADADVLAARAAMLPRLMLSASVGSGGGHLNQVFDNPLYSLAAGLAAPIFNAGRLAAGHDFALATREELLADYRQTIVTAFAETQSALANVHGVHAQRDAQSEELAQAQRVLTLSESRYRAGADTLLVLVDAQRTLYAAQDEAARLRALHLQAAIDLYKALGGGWRRDAPH